MQHIRNVDGINCFLPYTWEPRFWPIKDAAAIVTLAMFKTKTTSLNIAQNKYDDA